MESRNGFIDRNDLLFKHPFNMIVSGASGSGKTRWVRKFLENSRNLITKSLDHVIYCYGVFDKELLEFEKFGIEIHQGLPTEDYLKIVTKPLLLILDDLMIDAKSQYLEMLFTRGTHHYDISLVFITQNLFSKEVKIARNNAHYLVIMRNPAGELQIRNLGLQLFPRKLEYFLEAYKSATKVSFGYLLIDIHPSSTEFLRLSTNIFPTEYQTIYVPKKL